MINTIFYFPNEGEINFEGYYDRVGKNQDDGISNRTIVFEPDSGEIWKNGQKYSVGESVIKSWIQTYLDDNVQEVDLTGYATESWVQNYIQNQNYATEVWVENKGYLTQSNINGLFKDFSYSNGVLKFIKYDNSETRSITIETSQGGSGETTPYTQGTGINISNHVVSLKSASSNEIGGIKVGGSSELSGKNYPVLITSDGVAYVNVPWTSGQVNASYSVDVTPPVITVPTDTNGTGNVSNVKCNISVYYNGEPRAIDIDGIIVGTITRGSGKSASGIAATPVGNTAINVSFNNVSEFAGDSADIPINIKIGGSVIAAISISAIGMAAAPQSGANAITMWTSTETVHVGWEYNNCDPEVINFGVRSGDVVNTSFLNAGYTVWYSYGNQNSWTKLTSNPLTIDKTKLNLKYILVELRKGSSNTRVENTLVDSKYIHLIVDLQPVIGITDYKINVIQSTMRYKSGESDFSGLLKFQILFNSNGEWTPVTNSSITVIAGGNKWIEDSQIYDDTLSSGNWVVNTNDKTYTLDFSNDLMPYYDESYSMIYVYDGTTVRTSLFVPFIVEGADGEITGDGPQLGISGTVMRFYSYSTEEQIRTKGVTGGSAVKWYTGDGDEENGVKYLDVLYFDGAYYRKRGASGTISHAPTYTQLQVMTTNYVYSGSSSTNGEEWVCFNMNVDAAFNALIARHGFIENLTGHEIVITDVNEPVAGMTSASATSDSSKIDDVTRGSVRIWAGTPTGNNLYNCPFYVTNTGELHATKAIIEDGTFINKLTFERRKAYTPGANTPLQLYRRLYSVTKGELLQQYNGQKMYGVGTIKLNTNHLFVFSEGVFNNVSIGDYAGGSAYSELHLLLPPAHYFIGLSVIITNESYGFYKPNSAQPGSNSWNPCITLEQENLYQIGCDEVGTQYIPSYSKPDSDYICMTDKLFAVVLSGHNSGEVYITDGSGRIDLSGIWQLQKSESAGSNTLYVYGAILQKISLDEYAWIRVTAAEGYLKEDYPDMQDKVKALNAMWVVTGYAYKTVTSEQIQDGTIQRVDLSQDLQQEI